MTISAVFFKHLYGPETHNVSHNESREALFLELGSAGHRNWDFPSGEEERATPLKSFEMRERKEPLSKSLIKEAVTEMCSGMATLGGKHNALAYDTRGRRSRIPSILQGDQVRSVNALRLRSA